METRHEMPALTDEKRENLVERCEEFIKQCKYAKHAEAMTEADEMDLLITQIALAAMKAKPVSVVEPRDYLTAAQLIGEESLSKSVRPLFEGALFMGQTLFSSPPVLSMKPIIAPDLPDDCDRTEAHFKYQEAIRAAGYEVKSCKS